MKLPILLQSLDRIEEQEGKSKLLHNESKLYQLLKKVKVEISKKYAHKADRMDLHIEVTKKYQDEYFRKKAEQVEGQTIDLSNLENWGYLRGAFVLWTPDVVDYGRTHVTVTFFGDMEQPKLSDLHRIVADLLETVIF